MFKLNVIDLFSGCGGFSYGFQNAGFHIIAGVDNEQSALNTFKHNHDNSEAFNLDLFKDESIEKLAKFGIEKGGVDLIIAGPPCQGFSLTGSRNKEDKRNKLFYSVFSLAEKLGEIGHKPKAIIIENVPGLATLYDGKAKIDIEKQFELHGYTHNSQILYAPDYGVPQIRKRLFFVGLLNELGRFEFPKPVLSPDEYIGCEDAIGDLSSLENEFGSEISDYTSKPKSDYQKLMRKNSEKVYNHVGTKHTEHVINVISQVPEGGNHKDLPPGVGDSRKFNEAWTRYHRKRPSKTIDTGHRNHFHYKWHRVPSVRENARLQSFPDRFQVLGTKTQQYRQIGNAVPPLLGYHIAKKLYEILSDFNEKR
ncbi:DNA cytosine methyltransferase [Aliarcobacter butzleri]|uniref:DNA cytosine methyltransferase n=1 Tax=Aliarcobacter butzleri TaxID=28197 RepID=UPI001EDA3E86|nr:DNA cytosine methyltransferase [Aliarcobacter butzleri]MCG3671722.1 DNA cytosine methyltransferase [Aliarcobacter butzleri]